MLSLSVMKRSDKDAALDKLGERVPKMTGCDGRCWISCGPADMSDRERARIREAGYTITPAAKAMMRTATSWCEALTEDHRCAVYPIRPLICRIWGAAERSRCPYGCVPEGRYLSDAEVAELMAEADRIGGEGLPLGKLPDYAADVVADALSSGGVQIRMQYNVPAAFRPAAEEFPCPSCGFMLTRPSSDDRYGRCGHCSQIIDLENVTATPAAPARSDAVSNRKKRDLYLPNRSGLKQAMADQRALKKSIAELEDDITKLRDGDDRPA